MSKFKRMLAVLTAVQFLFIFALGTIHTKAAATAVLKPSLQMIVQPNVEYKSGDRISLTVTSPNYGGRVEYRVILWNGTTKTQSELWKTPKTGYYYKNWQPSGNYKFSIHWPAQSMEPGAYSLTVLVRRVGAKVAYDSYVKTNAFWIKPELELSSNYYESQNGKFKMKFPSEFVVNETTQGGINFAVSSRENEELPAFLALTLPTESGDNINNEMDLLKDEILKQIANSSVKLTEISRKKVTLANQDAYLVEYDLSAVIVGVEQKVKVVAMITLNETNTNIVMFVTTTKDWTENSNIYTQSFMSFVPTTIDN